MPNLIEVTYGRTGQSTNTDALGMREMQAKVYAQRDAPYLLVKAPPPLAAIEETIRLTLNAEIINYTFDTETNLIRKNRYV